MPTLPALGGSSPIHARLHMLYRDQVPQQASWYGLHNDLCVAWYIESGSVELRFDNHKLFAEAGQWVFQSPGLLLDQIFDPKTRLISIRYDLRWHNGQDIFHDANAACLYDRHHPQLRKSALALLKQQNQIGSEKEKENKSKSNDNGSSLALTSILKSQELFSRWLQHSYQAMSDLGFVASQANTGDSRCAEILSILKNSLDLCDVPYDLICQRCQLSRVHLNRIFLKEFGYSPKHQHDTFRIEYARSLLENHSTAIKNICRQLGFSDSSQFTKWFRRLDGHTPSAARKNIGHWV